MKTCTGPCGRTLPPDDFYRDKRSPDGRRSRCAGCDHPLVGEEIRSQQGLSPAVRARLDAEAKAVAIRFAVAVKARDAAEIQRIGGPMTREGAFALAINVAEALTDGFRLRAVTEAADDGLPDVTLAAPARSLPPAADESRPRLTVVSGDLGAVDAA
jgi:hypothetical protein